MKKVFKLLTIAFQIGITLISMFILYMLFAAFDYQGGIANFVGLAIFQPILAIFISFLTIIICGIIGLPIRINNRFNEWWRTNFYVAIVFGIIGFIFCLFSVFPTFIEQVEYRMDGLELTATVPNRFFSISGWFLIAFGLLHLFLPYKLEEKMISFLERRLNGKEKTRHNNI